MGKILNPGVSHDETEARLRFDCVKIAADWIALHPGDAGLLETASAIHSWIRTGATDSTEKP